MPAEPPPAHGREPGDALDARLGRAVVVAAALAVVVAAGLIRYGVFLVVQWFRDEPAQPLNAALIIGFSVGWGVALLACARGLRNRRRWARAPVITSDLVLVTVGWLLASGQGLEVGFGALVLALAVGSLVSLLRPTLADALR